jgi:excisionase family DNA binding protein
MSSNSTAATRTTARDLVLLTDVPALRPLWTLRHLRRVVDERRVPFYRFRKRVMLDLQDLDEYVERQRVEPVDVAEATS